MCKGMSYPKTYFVYTANTHPAIRK